MNTSKISTNYADQAIKEIKLKKAIKFLNNNGFKNEAKLIKKNIYNIIGNHHDHLCELPKDSRQ